MSPLPDRDGVGALTVIALAAFFSLFGAATRLIARWPEQKEWWVALGNLMVSMFASMLIGLIGWETFGVDHPAYFCALTASASWFGGEVIDRIGRKWLLPMLEGEREK